MADKLSPALKPIQPFLVIAKQFKKRDPIVSYYGEAFSVASFYVNVWSIFNTANMYAVQEGIRSAKGDPAAKAYLLTLMDEIETVSLSPE